jgi:hypothetical protein
MSSGSSPFSKKRSRTALNRSLQFSPKVRVAVEGVRELGDALPRSVRRRDVVEP